MVLRSRRKNHSKHDESMYEEMELVQDEARRFTEGSIYMKAHREASHGCKVIFVGDRSVGKTSLLGSLYGKEDWIVEYKGAARRRQVNTHRLGRARLGMEVWDINSWHHEYVNQREELLKWVDLAVIVFDITNAASYDNIQDYLDDFSAFSDISKDRLLLVANKIDHASLRGVSNDQIQDLGKRLGVWTFRTVAEGGGGAAKAERNRLLKKVRELLAMDRAYGSNSVRTSESFNHLLPANLDVDRLSPNALGVMEPLAAGRAPRRGRCLGCLSSAVP